MSLLEKLEIAVAGLLDKYTEAQKEIFSLKESQATLKESCSALEVALLQESVQNKELLDEKESIKGSIDELLMNIKILEEAQK
ncbi:cell division protein ZapB [Candidatus Babeliales bacterium]|nr:cell division protein ZapB [Candidatus Babeliales bacterium]